MYTNTNNSTIKTAIDNWYSENLTSYTNMLENTIFCNDRSDATSSIYRGPLASKDTNSTDGSSYFKSWENLKNGTPSLQCVNKNDQFSLSTTNGGTEGFGNNALTYPVGLLTLDEANLAGGQVESGHSNNYLYNGDVMYWVLSPTFWFYGYEPHVGMSYDGSLYWTHVDDLSRLRAVVSLEPGTEFLSGSGEPNNPYIVKTN